MSKGKRPVINVSKNIFLEEGTEEPLLDPILIRDRKSETGYKIINRSNLPPTYRGYLQELPELSEKINSNNNNDIQPPSSQPMKMRTVLVGATQSGKSSLLLKFTADKFISSYLPTTGIDYQNHNVDYEGRQIKMDIWDTSADSKIYRSDDAIILTYDSTDQKSFIWVQSWLSDWCSTIDCSRIVLAATKTDLPNKQVDKDEALALAKKYNLAGVIETSAKNNKHVDKCFLKVIKAVCDKKNTETVQNNEVLNRLNNYIVQREKDDRKYFHCFAKLFGGFSKEKKVNAAKALRLVLLGKLTPDTLEPHLPALKQGNLGNIYKEVEQSSKLIRQASPSSFASNSRGKAN